jgi:hypothetical protein
MEKKDFFILIPPSKEKKEGGDETKPYRYVQNLKKYNFFINLNTQREFIYSKIKEAIAELPEENLEKIFEVKGKNLHKFLEINSDLLNLPTMKAIERFNGVMFKNFNFESLNEKEKDNFNKKTIIVDGLFGLLKPYDFIPNYRFDINTKFLDVDTSNFWKDHIRAESIISFKDKIILDFLPSNYRKIITKPSSSIYIEINFAEEKNNELKIIGHNSKKLKGEILRYLSKFEEINYDDLKKFKHNENFIFSDKYSNKEKIIYIKKN